MAVHVALGLGGNEGDPYETIPRAVAQLAVRGFSVGACSSYYETEPVGCVPGTPAFVNCAIAGTWSGSARALLKLTQELEISAGRSVMRSRNSPRVLDIDILLFGEAMVTDVDLIIPHPRLAARLFVLVPLAEIVPDWVIPGVERTVSEMQEKVLGAATELWGRRVRCWEWQRETGLSLG